MSAFWTDFYEQCTVGNYFKVPRACHHFGEAEWGSVGRIIAVGWQKERYLPVKLEAAMLGSVKSDLVDSFLKFVSEPDRKVLESWRLDFEGVDLVAVMTIMGRYD